MHLNDEQIAKPNGYEWKSPMGQSIFGDEFTRGKRSER
jgi:hypothetical protein